MDNAKTVLSRLNRNEQLTPELFDELLSLALEYKATEIDMSTGEPIRACVAHKWGTISDRPLDTNEIENVVASIQGPEAKTLLSAGRDLDFSHQIGRGDTAKRFRINVTPTQVRGNSSLDFTCRLLDAAPPPMSKIGLTETDFGYCNQESGVNLITGPTGSGKSTTLASFTRRHIEGPEEEKDLTPRRSFEFVGKKIVEYSAPIEYVYTAVPRRYGFISQSEIPRNIESFAAAARNSMRRFAQIINLGETRDPLTAVEVPNIGATGHLLYTSFHGNSCGDSIDRFNLLFPSADRAACSANLLSVLNVIICQRLLPRRGGGVVAIREKAFISREIKNELMRMDLTKWGNHLNNILIECKLDFVSDAKRLVNQKLLTESVAACMTK